jgi:hypothetical protein
MVNRLAVKFIAILFVPPQHLLTNCAGGWGAT